MKDSKYSALYRDVFNLHRKYYPPRGWDDGDFWSAFHEEMNEVFLKYQTTFASELLRAVYEELERIVEER